MSVGNILEMTNNASSETQNIPLELLFCGPYLTLGTILQTGAAYTEIEPTTLALCSLNLFRRFPTFGIIGGFSILYVLPKN